MSDSPQTRNVFLDTEVFRAHQLDFESPNIRRLVKLAAEGHVQLLVTTVTRGEILDDLKEEAKEALKKLKEVRRDARVMRKIMPEATVATIEAVRREDAVAILQRQLGAFIAEARATVLGLDQVSAEAVFRKYFTGMPPFGGEGSTKKAEFPDAFACGALEAWSTANNNAEIYVVSNDSDWKKMCESSEVLLPVSRLDELLQHFTDTEISMAIKKALEEQREALLQEIRTRADDLEFFLGGDSLIDGEIEEYEILDVDIEDLHVVEIQDGKASVSVRCQASVSANVVADDPDSWIKDSETKSVHYMLRIAGRVERTVELTTEVSVEYYKDDPERITIEKVEFEENCIALYVDEQELERVDDYDAAAEYQQYQHEQEMEYQVHLMEQMEPDYEGP